jgi:hypothetical protein
MQANAKHDQIGVAREMNRRRNIIQQISAIVNGFKDKPQRLQSDEKNRKLSERHPLPKPSFRW